MSVLFAGSVARLRAAPVVDKYGNPSAERDWEHAAQTTFAGVSVQPNIHEETIGDRTALTTGWRLFTRRGVDMDLLPTDRVVANGVTYGVDGEVARYSLSGAVHHIEARLLRISG